MASEGSNESPDRLAVPTGRNSLDYPRERSLAWTRGESCRRLSRRVSLCRVERRELSGSRVLRLARGGSTLAIALLRT